MKIPRKAQGREWIVFEKRIENEVKIRNVSIIKIPENVVGVFGKKKAIRTKSHIDFIAGVNGLAVFFDAKVTRDRLWNLKKYVFDAGKVHQYVELVNARKNGNIAGYFVWFIEHEKISWIPIELVEYCYNNRVASISPDTETVVSIHDEEMIDLTRFINVKSIETNNSIG